MFTTFLTHDFELKNIYKKKNVLRNGMGEPAGFMGGIFPWKRVERERSQYRHVKLSQPRQTIADAKHRDVAHKKSYDRYLKENWAFRFCVCLFIYFWRGGKGWRSKKWFHVLCWDPNTWKVQKSFRFVFCAEPRASWSVIQNSFASCLPQNRSDWQNFASYARTSLFCLFTTASLKWRFVVQTLIQAVIRFYF